MTRREQREAIFKILFVSQFRDQAEMPEQEDLFLDSVREDWEEKEQELLSKGEEGALKKIEKSRVTSEDQAYIAGKANKILGRIPEIDSKLNATSKGWKTSRMNKADLSILRLAVYEMLYDEDIPVGVAINEAVELAKKFGGDESASFVNGILGVLSKESDKT